MKKRLCRAVEQASEIRALLVLVVVVIMRIGRMIPIIHIPRFLTSMPLPARMAIEHGLITWVYLLFFPPPPETPPIAIPIVWAASYSTTLGLTLLTSGRPKYPPGAHWVR